MDSVYDTRSPKSTLLFWIFFHALPFIISQSCRAIVAASGFFPNCGVSVVTVLSGLFSWIFATAGPAVAESLTTSSDEVKLPYPPPL